MKNSLFSFVVAFLCIVLYAEGSFNVTAACDNLLASGSETISGETEMTGLWVVAIGRTEMASHTEKDAKALAILDAKRALATFLNAQVSSAAEHSMKEDDTGVSSSFSQWARIDVNQALAGVRIEKTVTHEGEILAFAVMTEKTADVTNRLKRAIAQEKPGTVEATGMGATQEAALQAACRSALEQVCGTSVVASDAAVGDAIRSRTYADVQGMVSAYRVIKEVREGNDFSVTILAEINKEELQESYGAQMKSMGEPLFWITSDNEDAAVEMTDFLMNKGLKTSVQKGTSDYKVELKAEFNEVTHPVKKRKGTQLQLTALCYDKTGVLMFSLANDPRKATFFTGNTERQRQLAVARAVKQMGKPLHERLQRAIADMVNNGRTVRMVFRNVASFEQCAFIEGVTEVINDMPGASAATYLHNDDVKVSTIRFSLKGNPQDFVGLLRERVETLPEALSVSTNKIVFEL